MAKFLKNGREGVPSGTDSIRIVGPKILESFFLDAVLLPV